MFQARITLGRRARWTPVAPGVTDTFLRYLDQLALTRRPATVREVEGVLREFALFSCPHPPDVGSVADLRRSHVEAYRLWLAKRPAYGHDRPVTRKTQAKRLATLRQCFERISDWERPDAPPRLASDSGR